MSLISFDEDAKASANRLVVFRRICNEKLFIVTRHGFWYCILCLLLALISAFQVHTSVNEKIVALVQAAFIWIQKPMTFLAAAVYFLISSIVYMRYQNETLPHEDKLDQKGYVLVQNNKKENWLIRREDGKAEKLYDLVAYSRGNRRPKLGSVNVYHNTGGEKSNTFSDADNKKLEND